MKLSLSSIQWMVFILAGSLVAPIAVGDAFNLSQSETAQLLQRCFLIIGLSGILQVLFGHKLPVLEGPAGLWWGVFTVYAGIAAGGTLTFDGALQELMMGMFISGALFIVLALFKWIEKLRTWFTPLVTGTYLILLVSQLSGSFKKGILGIGYLNDQVDGKVAAAAITVLIFSIILGKSKIKWMRSYSILISLMFGWGLFTLLDLNKETADTSTWFQLPKLFDWGIPHVTGGITVTSLFIGFLLLTNMVASISVTERAFQSANEHYKKVNYNRASFFMGISTWIAGMLSAIAPVPISGSAGFMLTTRIFSKLPFIIGNVFVITVSFFPKVTYFFAGIPAPVGYATIFLPFSSMIALALKEYRPFLHIENKLFIIATSLMIGIGAQFLPPAALSGLPSILVTLLSNGLVLGMMTCILLEQATLAKEK
ncbi:purine/pyrimidine permease [Fictibacillus iocasae]|uniref:Purine/pyrimidine permease n=1 Tax=Fictibacillus iocasae TaxID=2715437 RepID=A0ABW2NRQ8_9BACL